MTVYVIRRRDGQYFQGCGYGGPGHPVPYWTDRICYAQAYKTVEGCMKAAKKLGAYAGAAEASEESRIPVAWLGFLVPGRTGWRPVQDDPRSFDPKDYDGNNRQL
jgi:hypothetical protein